MEKEFDVNEGLNFPNKIVIKNVEGFKIILAPDYPNWIVLDQDEFSMFSDLMKKFTILQTMENFIDKQNVSEDAVIKIMTKLLSKIEDVKFYKNTKTFSEDKIESFPKLIHINLTNNCNLRCRHCYMSAGRYREQSIDFDRLKNFFENLKLIQNSSEIVLSGGEPLVYKDFYQVLNFLDDGKNKITLFTNGTLINDKNYKFIVQHTNEIQISFEGITENYFELIRGKGTYKKVINAMNLLKSCGIKIVLAITLLPMTADDVKKNLVNFVKFFDYENLEIRLNNKLEFTGNAANFDKTEYDKKYLDDIVINLMKELSNIGINIKFANDNNIKFTNCGIGTNIVIHYDENIYPCHKFSDYNFKISDNVDKIFKQFNELNRNTSIYHIKKCCCCELKYICTGGCKIDTYIRNKSFLHTNCNEKFKETIYHKILFEYLRS